MFFKLLFAVVVSGAVLVAQDPWPDLPSDAFIAGRVATTADIEAGRAAFVVPGGSPHEAIDLLIPQYAIWVDETGQANRVVLIQAERTQIGDIVGLRGADGGEYVATMKEVQLLGQERPSQ